MKATKDHLFRLTKRPARRIQEATRRFAKRETSAFKDWSEYRRHKRVIEDALAGQLINEKTIDPRVKVSLAALRKTAEGRIDVVRDAPFQGPPVFHVGPGLNVLGPPYDFGLNVALGSNQPSVQVSINSGSFGVVATAVAGKNTYGSAGVSLFIVPSDPNRALSIRPYFEWNYIYSCESHGPPTAHSYGTVSAEVTGHRGSGSTDFPGKSLMLWTTGSDIWDDTHGDDSDVFRNPDSELIVSGHDYYTVSYVCQTSADSGKASFGWYSEAYVQFHCRVPFIVVQEF
jgi:hypothetical protein